MATSRAIGHVLATSVACWPAERIRTHVSELAAEHGAALSGLARAAAFHGIGSYVHDAIAHETRIPEPDRRAVKALRDGTAMVHLRTMADLSYLRGTLDEAAVPWLVVKGPALARHHGGPGRRSYSDLDVVVPGGALGDALAALEASGSQVEDRNWTLIRDEMKGEVHLRLPTGTPLDLHWHLLNDRPRRAAFPIPITDLFQRRQYVEVAKTTIPTLGLADTVVYVALHTMLSGAHRLVWLKDLERLSAAADLSPAAVLDVASRWRAELVLACALQRVDRAIPDAATRRRLALSNGSTGAWGAFTGLVWRLSAAEQQDGAASLGRVVARSVRATPGASFRELANRSRDRIRDGDGARAATESFPADDPRSGRYPSGGDAMRNAFLDEVSRHAQ